MTDFEHQELEFCGGIYHNANVDYAALIWEDFNTRFITVSLKSEDVRSCPIPVDDDEVLYRLKFIDKGDIYQVYGKPILDTWITDEIKKSKAYKMYFKYSTGLIPLKNGRGRATQALVQKLATYGHVREFVAISIEKE
ncbi:hypothetical protein Tco_0940172 [Tanacetum coccineum]|uniref:Uncharacterized protein n=1 Tax=Tanacetum coccineum TaxID=301880 RepID=A0ABQ5DPK8_9ASTR